LKFISLSYEPNCFIPTPLNLELDLNQDPIQGLEKKNALGQRRMVGGFVDYACVCVLFYFVVIYIIIIIILTI